MQLFISDLLIDYTKLQENIYDSLLDVKKSCRTSISEDFIAEVDVNEREHNRHSEMLNSLYKNHPAISFKEKITRSYSKVNPSIRANIMKIFNDEAVAEVPTFHSLKGYQYKNGTIKEICRVCLCVITDRNFRTFYSCYKKPNSKNWQQIMAVLPRPCVKHYQENFICSNCSTLISHSYRIIEYRNNKKTNNHNDLHTCPVCSCNLEENNTFHLKEIKLKKTKQHVLNTLKHLLPDFNCNQSVICYECLNLVTSHNDLCDIWSRTEKELSKILQEKTHRMQASSTLVIMPHMSTKKTNWKLITNKTDEESHILDHNYTNCSISNDDLENNFDIKIPENIEYNLDNAVQHFNVFNDIFMNFFFDLPYTKSQDILKIVRNKSNCFDDKPCLCEFCGLKYWSRKKFLSHLFKHTEKTCQLCNSRFNFRSELHKHNLKVHQIVSSYVCEKCGKNFQHKKSLTVHMNEIHQNKRSHKCEECNKVFRTARSLTTHNRMYHMGRWRHTCQICQQKFLWKSNMVKHMTKCNGKSNSKYDQKT